MAIKKDDIEHSITILSGLLGYSERMGLVSDINEKMYCKWKNTVLVYPFLFT